jgi:hypothetical protein
MTRHFFWFTLTLVVAELAAAPAAGPRIFYTDLESGPNTGGEDGLGAFVTVRGARFGATPGNVTVGGGNAARIVSWSNSQIVIQLGPAARSGNIVVEAGGLSNGVPFRVRPGSIYFVAPEGDDAASGAFENPWRTIQNAVNRMTPGDIAYVRDGVTETGAQSPGASVMIRNSGTPEQPMTLAAYPGAAATIGEAAPACTASCVEGLELSGEVDPEWWVVAGLRLHGSNYALSISGQPGGRVSNIRVVGNEFYCPNGTAGAGCLLAARAEHLTVLGNYLRQAGTGTSPKLQSYHGMHFAGTNFLEAAWNRVEKVRGCGGIVIDSSGPDGKPGSPQDSPAPKDSPGQRSWGSESFPALRAPRPEPANQHHISIHHNVIGNTICDGIALRTVDPSQGPVEVYNNVIVGAGGGSEYAAGPFACVAAPGYTANGEPAQGVIEVYHNTVADCGTARTPSSGAFYKGGLAALNMRLTNNLMYQFEGQQYVTVVEGEVLGTANHVYGAGRLPQAPVATFLHTNSPFASYATGVLSLLPGSRSLGTGAVPAAEIDIAGHVRSTPGSIGAYEFPAQPGAELESGIFEIPFRLSASGTGVRTAPKGGGGSTPLPALLYSDLTSGPNTGGRNNTGAVVCVSGYGFGATRGTSTVTVGGGAVADYPFWSDTRACVSLGPAAATGNIVLTTAGGASNGLPFTVRPGNIYYAGSTADIGGSPGNASDANTGTFHAPKATIKACKNLMTSPGDLCYVRGTVPVETSDTFGSLNLTQDCTEVAPCALVAWPGDTRPQIGNESMDRGLHMFIGNGNDADWWTVSGFRIVAKEAVRSLQVNQGIRLTNNLLECPQGDGSRGCLTEAQAIGNPSVLSNWKLFGNITQNAGCGDGATGGINDAASAPGQTWQLPCATNTTSATLTSQTVGADYVCVSVTGAAPSVIVGDVVIIDSNGDSTTEEVFVEALTCASNTSWWRLRRSQLATTTFSARPFSWRPHINSKLYHVWYCGTDCSGMEQGWNIFRNNSAILTSNFHSTPCSGGARSIVSVTAGPPGTPARLVISSGFTPMSSGGGGSPVNGDRIDLTDGHSAGERPVYVSVVSPTEFDLYTDPALTTPYETSGTGGWATRCGFHQHSLLIHDNLYYRNNGACIDFSTADPDMGPIRAWNNIFWECGTGPDAGRTTPGANQASGISIHFLTREGNSRYGTTNFRKIEILNNTFYKSGTQADTAFRGAIVHQQPLWDVVVRNNIFHQPDGLPFFYMAPGTRRINSDRNIWFGTNTASVPTDVIRHSGDKNNPRLDDPAAGVFTLHQSSPARDNGATLAEVTQDFYGVLRPQGKQFDIGAVEMPQGSTTRTAASIVSATAVSSGLIRLEFDDNSTGHALRIERAAGSGETFAVIATLEPGITRFHDTGLDAATAYCYRVAIEDADGVTSYSPVQCAATSASTGR